MKVILRKYTSYGSSQDAFFHRKGIHYCIVIFILNFAREKSFEELVTKKKQFSARFNHPAYWPNILCNQKIQFIFFVIHWFFLHQLWISIYSMMRKSYFQSLRRIVHILAGLCSLFLYMFFFLNLNMLNSFESVGTLNDFGDTSKTERQHTRKNLIDFFITNISRSNI